MNCNSLELPTFKSSVVRDQISLVRYYLHDYVLFSRLIGQGANQLVCGNIRNQDYSQAGMPWKKLKHVLDRAHSHEFGHSNYNDIKTLLMRKNLWIEDCASYLSKVVLSCRSCHETDLPTKSRTVSLNNFSWEFIDFVFVDHVFPEEETVLHALDAVTRYSIDDCVEAKIITDGVHSFESGWISKFWMTPSVQGEPALNC